MTLLRALRIKKAHVRIDRDETARTELVLAKLDAAVERFRTQIDRIETLEQRNGDPNDG